MFQDIKKFLDESVNGVIYFSMGSIIQGKSFPSDKRKAFLRAFEQIPQRVIWKWEGENMSGKIDKILLKSWAPQRDILGKFEAEGFSGLTFESSWY